MKLSVRNIEERDISHLLNYWYSCDADYLKTLGADINKLPSREDFGKMLLKQISAPFEDKKAYATIWLIDDVPKGHCNTNMIHFEKEANMHLHLWEPMDRHKGIALSLAKESMKLFFENLNLKKLICEPYALNPAPNKFLPKLGYTFIKKYETIPGSINFQQEVNRYEITKETFQKIK